MGERRWMRIEYVFVCVCAAFFSLESFVSVHDNEHSYVAEAKATLNFAYVEIFIAIFSALSRAHAFPE